MLHTIAGYCQPPRPGPRSDETQSHAACSHPCGRDRRDLAGPRAGDRGGGVAIRRGAPCLVVTSRAPQHRRPAAVVAAVVGWRRHHRALRLAGDGESGVGHGTAGDRRAGGRARGRPAARGRGQRADRRSRLRPFSGARLSSFRLVRPVSARKELDRHPARTVPGAGAASRLCGPLLPVTAAASPPRALVASGNDRSHELARVPAATCGTDTAGPTGRDQEETTYPFPPPFPPPTLPPIVVRPVRRCRRSPATSQPSLGR